MGGLRGVHRLRAPEGGAIAFWPHTRAEDQVQLGAEPLTGAPETRLFPSPSPLPFHQVMPFLPRLMIQLASLGFLYSAFVAWDARSSIKAGWIPPPSHRFSQAIPLPLPVILQVLAAFALLTIGLLWSANSLIKISWASEMADKTIDAQDSTLGFRNVRTRASKLFRDRSSS
ncbi:BQ2448_7072 [Microbotryum intermedium]|uniref:BQ2448_7072 protein n=1 Tax=Microbotryum intermedium TaxID=269621 RepID=A0A238FIS1_9BASI|nr:BQ2448_7072 [Microbotryum intermedium]